jgi:hypothetical protein
MEGFVSLPYRGGRYSSNESVNPPLNNLKAVADGWFSSQLAGRCSKLEKLNRSIFGEAANDHF